MLPHGVQVCAGAERKGPFLSLILHSGGSVTFISIRKTSCFSNRITHASLSGLLSHLEREHFGAREKLAWQVQFH